MQKVAALSGWILTCVKTGRFWSCHSEAHAKKRARDLGLKDYEISNERKGD